MVHFVSPCLFSQLLLTIIVVEKESISITLIMYEFRLRILNFLINGHIHSDVMNVNDVEVETNFDFRVGLVSIPLGLFNEPVAGPAGPPSIFKLQV